MKKARDVDEYIANAPENVRDKLKALRKTIKDSASGAEEKISYNAFMETSLFWHPFCLLLQFDNYCPNIV